MVARKSMDGAKAARIMYGGTGMSINNILHDIQKNLSVPKNKKNSFGGYNYRSAEDIVDAVKAKLDYGCTLTMTDAILMVGDRFYVKSTATLSSEKGDKISCDGYAREPLSKKGFDESQITGAASSYARKYALNGLFAIDDGVDADAAPKAPNPPKSLTPAQKKELAIKAATNIKSDYMACKNLEEMVEVQKKHSEALIRLSEGYGDVFDDVNTVAKMVMDGFNDKIQG
jgi:hypothetical protein